MLSVKLSRGIFAVLLVASCQARAEGIPASSAPAGGAKRTLGLALSAGIPDLINFQAQYLRVGWLRFGYGLGTQPVKKALEKFARIRPEAYVFDVNEEYEVFPRAQFSLRAFNSFVRLFPGTSSFYLEAKGTTWKVEATVEAMVRNKQTRAVASAGSVSFRVLQPMLGGGIGYQAIWNSGLFVDCGLGASYLFMPVATYWSAVRAASATFGYLGGEYLDVTAGTVKGENRTQGAVSGSYYLSDGKMGFGVSAEYLHVTPSQEHLVNRAGAGLGTEVVQAGFNFLMNATTWIFSHDLTVRVGKSEGLAVALRTPDISSLTTEFLLGVGYAKKGTFTLEADCPLNTDNMLARPRIEMLHPSVSLSVQTVKNALINVGIDGINLTENGGGQGTVHAGLLWWIRGDLGLTFTLNKRYVYAMGMVEKL